MTNPVFIEVLWILILRVCTLIIPLISQSGASYAINALAFLNSVKHDQDYRDLPILQ